MSNEVNKKDPAVKKARKAQKAMLAYMEENNLDPNKDWTKHKKHGKKIQEWIDIINLGNKKAREINEKKAIENGKKNKKPEAHPKKEKVTTTLNIYDYPKVDGKDMTPDQKKKYRQKMRTLLKTMSKDKAEAEALDYAKDMVSKSTPIPKVKKEEPKKEEPKKEEPKKEENVSKKEEKKPEKKKDKKKKVAKEED